jgi:hypothetical protein
MRAIPLRGLYDPERSADCNRVKFVSAAAACVCVVFVLVAKAEDAGIETDCGICRDFSGSLNGSDPDDMFAAERDACHRCWTARRDPHTEIEAERHLRSMEERTRRHEMNERGGRR